MLAVDSGIDIVMSDSRLSGLISCHDIYETINEPFLTSDSCDF